MKNMDDSGIPGNGGRNGDRLCEECGSSVEKNFRFCPGCGAFIPDDAPVTRLLSRDGSAPEEEEPAGKGLFRGFGRFGARADDTDDQYEDDDEENAVSISTSMSQRLLRSNADRAGTSFREFNAAIKTRRDRRERHGGILLVLLFLMFVSALGGGVYWFLQQAERIPWDDGAVSRPVEPADPVQTSPDPSASSPATPGTPSDETPMLPLLPSSPASVHADVLEISRPTKGIVIGSSVNLRGSHSVSSPVVGKVTIGNEAEVLESWTSDEGAEVVALSDVNLTAADGKMLRITRGRGVTVLSGPDGRGALTVALPDDRAKTPYTVAASAMSNPHSWPWYKIRPRGGKEGWIFGKFITVFNPRENSLSPTILDRALSSFGSTRDQITAILGQPLRTSSKKTGTVEELSLVYDGMTIVLQERSASSEVKAITLTSSKHALEGGLSVGIDRRAVLSILGLPNALERGSEVYRVNATTGIRVRYENYTVRSLHAGPLN